MFAASKTESGRFSSGSSGERKKRRVQAGRAVAFLLVLGISVAIMLGRNQIERLAVYTYPAVFLVSLLGHATVLMPVPSFAVAFTAGVALDPLVVGLVAGLGAAIGEMTGYLAGFGGQGVIEDRPLFRRIRRWMEKSGTLVIFLLSALPNPFFDVGGMMAGVARMPIWRFLLAGWLGKSIRLSVVAFTGALVL